jgi:hypothetical protein
MLISVNGQTACVLMREFHPANGYRLKRPFWHEYQKRAFDRSLHLPRFAFWHEPRCGKSDLVSTTACYHYSIGESSPMFTRGVLIIVWPQGGQIGWINDCFPATATVPWDGMYWDSRKMDNKKESFEFKRLCASDNLAVFAVNGEALVSERCRWHIGKFLHDRKLNTVVGDEISAIANSRTKRNGIMQEIGLNPFVRVKRVLDGTPVDKKGPLDYYTEVGFLDMNILGYPNQTEYEAHYAAFKTRGRAPFWSRVKELEEKGFTRTAAEDAAKRKVKEDGRERRSVRGRDWWPELVGFKNVDELHNRLNPVSDRCTYRQAFPSSKEMVFAKRYFELTAEQRRVYTQIDREHRATLQDGTEVSITHHLTRTLRLQQVASNYYPDNKVGVLHETCHGEGCDECDAGVVYVEGPPKIIDKNDNPRLEALRVELKEGKPSIVWTRFRPDAEACFALAESLGARVCRYDGSVAQSDKLKNRTGFQGDKFDVIVGNWASMSRAIPLHRAEKQIAYNNQFSFRFRVQGEGRSEHGSKTFATSWVDLVAVNTVDDNVIIPALRTGMDVSAYIQQDERRAWI